MIELADDLQTAKGMWYSQGSKADVTESGPVSYWTFGVFCVDFVPENGAWKIWHLQYLEDVKCLCGQGWQYQHEFYRNELAKHGVIQSMSRKGNCYDNCIMETFFGRLKMNVLWF